MAVVAEKEVARPPSGAAEETLPSILAIVVTHDGRRWLTDCLVALSSQSYPLLDVLVVDDASAETKSSELKRVAKRHLRRRRWGYLRTARPLGFGGAINWALSRIKTDADLLLFVHDDAALDPGSVEHMVARLLADDATAIVGPKVVSWDDPSRLEEVGMAADRFGYPYKGLEDGEIDLGQHDASQEVFFVTSTCMLVRHDVFKSLRGWDGHMRAFSEDLDLCWRAHIAGYKVRVEPRARARHAIALARNLRASPFLPTRYYIRRNRLRTVAKNVSGLRLLALVPLFVLLAVIEMLAFTVLRLPGEIMNLARALGWNLLTTPQTLTERARVQRTRKVPDRKLRRLTVRQSTRVRSYVGNQAEHLEEVWGRRAELLARRANRARSAVHRLKAWAAPVLFVALIVLVLGFRDFLFEPQASVGELLPYPERLTGLWRSYLSPWRGAGLGDSGASPPALFLLGVVPWFTLGAAGAAQKLLVLGLGLIAFIGAYRLVSDAVDRGGRLAAALAYGFGAVGYAGLRGGDLGALVFGAAAPYVLTSLLRLGGWVRPPGWNRGRAVARVALGGAVSAAFVPGSLLLYGLCALAITAARALTERNGLELRKLTSSLVGLGVAWGLLLPWSASWLAPGGPLARLRGESWKTYASTFEGHGMASVILGQTPRGPALFGLALPLLGIFAVAIGRGQRRRLALALWTVVIVTGLATTVFEAGFVRPLVASSTQAGVLAAAAFAGLAGLAVGAFRLDLPRRGLGLVHAFTLGCFALAAFGVAAGVFPAMWHGEWAPGRQTAWNAPAVTTQIRSLLSTEAATEGHFRALWVGRGWSLTPSAARPPGHYFLTGPKGQSLTDLFERSSGPGDLELERTVESIERGSTDQGGLLLGAFNIRYVVLERSAGAARWLSQRDLAVVRTAPHYLLLHNGHEVARAAVYDAIPSYVRALQDGDLAAAAGAGTLKERVTARQQHPASYEAEDVRGPGTVFLAENRDPEWRATLGGADLEMVDGGWGNAFAVPAEATGTLSISFPRSLGRWLWLFVIGLAWIVVAGAAFARRPGARGPAGIEGPPL